MSAARRRERPRRPFSLNHWLATRSQLHLFWAVVAVDSLLITILLLFWLIPQQARFAIVATTEAISIRVPGGQPAPRWGTLPLYVPPPPPGVAPDPGTEGCVPPSLELAEIFPRPVDMALMRREGALEVTFNGHGQSLGRLRCPGRGDVSAPSFAVVRFPVDASPSPTLRFSGELEIGREVKAGGRSALLLQEGVLTVEAESRPFRSGKVSSETKLNLGDSVRFFAGAGDRPAISHGIVRAQDGVLRIVAHATAEEATVLRPGQETSLPVSIAPTFLARVQAQAEWAILLIIGTLVLNMLSALASLTEANRGEASR